MFFKFFHNSLQQDFLHILLKHHLVQVTQILNKMALNSEV